MAKPDPVITVRISFGMKARVSNKKKSNWIWLNMAHKLAIEDVFNMLEIITMLVEAPEADWVLESHVFDSLVPHLIHFCTVTLILFLNCTIKITNIWINAKVIISIRYDKWRINV